MYTWKTLHEAISSMSEETVLAALNQEVEGKKRWTLIKRLHQRYCTLRANRERAVFLKLCGKTADDAPDALEPPVAPV